MPRRSSRSEPFLIELYDTLKAMPWWGGAIAVVFAWSLFAVIFPLVFSLVGNRDEQIGRTMSEGLTAASTLFAPWAAGLVAFVWLWALIGKFVDARRLDRQTGIESIRKLSWQHFERLLAEAFRRQGYSVQETPPTNDGGVDLILTREGRRTLVQCKHWKTWSVGVRPVRELAGVVSAHGADTGIVVASGRYTRGAHSFADVSGIQLIDGAELEKMIKGVQHSDVVAPPQAVSAQTVSNDPACPLCGTPMIRRTARRGANAGADFWGCPRFPACRGTRPLA